MAFGPCGAFKGDLLKGHLIGTLGEGLSGGHRVSGIALEDRRTGNADEDHHDAHVHDVTAVASLVVGDQPNQGGEGALAMQALPCSGAVDDVGGRAHQNKDAEGVGDGGHDLAHAEKEEQHGTGQGEDHRQEEMAHQQHGGRFAPGQQGADAGQGQQRQSKGHIEMIEPAGGDGDLRAANKLGENGEQGTPEHGEHDAHQQHVIEEEGTFPGNDRFDAVFGGQLRQSVENKSQAGEDDHHQEGEEEITDAGLGEGVHRRDHAGAGDEGAQDAEGEGQ